jgi:hypothetical protein
VVDVFRFSSVRVLCAVAVCNRFCSPLRGEREFFWVGNLFPAGGVVPGVSGTGFGGVNVGNRLGVFSLVRVVPELFPSCSREQRPGWVVVPVPPFPPSLDGGTGTTSLD